MQTDWKETESYKMGPRNIVNQMPKVTCDFLQNTEKLKKENKHILNLTK